MTDYRANKKAHFISVYSLDEKIKVEWTELKRELEDSFGTYMEAEDGSDVQTAFLKRTLEQTKIPCDALIERRKQNCFIRIAKKMPLLPFISVVQDKKVLINKINMIKTANTRTSNQRADYQDISTYAFQSEDFLRSFWPQNARRAPWNVKFELLATSDSTWTWRTVLGYDEAQFQSWWKEKHISSAKKASDGWSDLKAMCKSVVYVLDITSPASRDAFLDRFPSFARLSKTAKELRAIATALVLQYSGHPDQTLGISKLFGLTVPIIFALSDIVQRARNAYRQNAPIQALVSETLSAAVGELESLAAQIHNLTTIFGSALMAEPYISSTEEGNPGLGYARKPTLEELFDTDLGEALKRAKVVMLDSGLYSDASEMNTTSDGVRRMEAEKAVEIVTQHSDSSCARYARELEELGLMRKSIRPGVGDILGSGSFSMVVCHSSEDGSEEYAIKQNTKCEDAWMRVKKEALVWARLDHENILKLLGYCIVPGDDLPSLVSPVCRGLRADVFLTREVPVQERTRLRLLHDAAKGLNYLHTNEVAHGDLRAANVLVQVPPDGEPRAVLCDFGMARLLKEDQECFQCLASNQRTSDNWLAPELMCANEGVGVCASSEGDIFAFGCVVLEIMSNVKPYGKYHPDEVKKVRLEGALPAVEDDMGDKRRYWPFAFACWNTIASERPNARYLSTALGTILQSGVLL